MKKKILILGAGPQQIKLYEIAQQMGLITIAVDYNSETPAHEIADYFLHISVKDAKAIIISLEERGLIPDGVVTCGVEVSPVVASIAEHFDLPGIPFDVAENTTNKIKRNKVLRSAGVPVPEFCEAKPFTIPKISLPFVLKPTDGSGSRGVIHVTKKEEYSKAFAEASSFSGNGAVLCEQLLNGTEVSIEGFVLNNILKVTGIAQRHFFNHEDTYPYFLEWGGTMPPYFNEETIRKCESVFLSAVRALKIENGPTKGDLIITDDGVVVLEITSRSSPGFAAEFQPLHSGVEPLRALLTWAIGEKGAEKYLLKNKNVGVAHRYYIHDPGIIKKIIGFDEISDQPGVKYVLKLANPKIGDRLEPVNYMNRLLYIITTANNRDEAVDLAEKALKTIKIIVEEK